jgi:putative oxidoreductase
MSALFLIQTCVRTYDRLIDGVVKYTQDLFLLVLRVYIASIFFQSGWTKFDNLWTGGWFKTVFLFKNVYKLPLISPEVAAVLGTGAELIFSVFLALGIMARVGALGLLGVTAVINFGVHAHFTHEFWALLLGVSLIMGPGKFSFDGWIRSVWNQHHSNALAELEAQKIVDPKAPQIIAKDKPNEKITLDNKIEPIVKTRLSKRKLIAEPDKIVTVKSLLKQPRQKISKQSAALFAEEVTL